MSVGVARRASFVLEGYQQMGGTHLFRPPWLRFRALLLTSVALVFSMSSGLAADIDGTSETVNGAGGGSIGSPWNVYDHLYVGNTGSGDLTISNGGYVENETGYLGYSGGSAGAVTVTGAGSEWSNTSDLYVGHIGDGTLTVSDGATVSSTGAYIAYAGISTGDVTITGAGSSWSTAGNLYLGFLGDGELTLSDGGVLNAGAGGGWISLAQNSGATGTLNIGAAAGETAVAAGTANAGGIYFSTTAGTLVFNHTDTGYEFAPDVTGEGRIELYNGTTTFTGDMSGFTGEIHADGGMLSITNGSQVFDSYAYIGSSFNSDASVLVSGAGSEWTNSGALYVGDNGTGTLTIENGGSVSSGVGLLGVSASADGSVLVTGSGSSWNSDAYDMYVGYEGAGELTIADGGSVTLAAGAGTVTLGLRAMGSSTGTLNIGAAAGDTAVAAGTLNAEALHFGLGTGQLVFNHTDTDYSFDANISGSGNVDIYSGTTTLTGTNTYTGSTKIHDGTLAIAGSTTHLASTVVENGTLLVQAGGTLSDDGHGLIGYSAGTSGSATVSGAGSTWSNSGDLYLGYNGAADLTIAEGGAVSNDIGYLGYNTDASGTVTVTGPGSEWTTSSDIHVGYMGAGSLTITNGGVVNNVQSVVGNAIGTGTGEVIVSGSGSQWNSSSDLYIGGGGTGTLTVSDGGTVSSGQAQIALFSGSTGVVTVTGATSSWSSTGDITVGDSGDGTLTLADGGTVSVSGGSGALNVTQFSTGTGTLNIGAASGDVAVAAGVLNAASVDFGAGSGNIVFNHTDTDYSFSANITGVGVVDVYSGTTTLTGTNTYTGTTTIHDGTLGITGSSTGAVSTLIEDGALLVAAGGNLSNSGSGNIGTAPGTSGTAEVTGVGSEWTIGASLNVGDLGTGELTISNGGSVSSATGYIGSSYDAIGLASVTGAGSEWVNSGYLAVGNLGTGTLLISDGGSVSNTLAVVGTDPDSSGTVIVTGAGSSWLSSSDLYIGGDDVGWATGLLTVSDGAAVSAGGGEGTITLAYLNSATGTLNIGAAEGEAAQTPGTLQAAELVIGGGHAAPAALIVPSAAAAAEVPSGGTLVFNHTASDYTLDSDISGIGTVKHIAGDTNLTGDGSGFSGNTVISGGLLSVNDILGGTVSVTGGAVGGNGTIGTVDIASGGALAPGNSVGTLNVVDANFASGSTYDIELNDGGFVSGTNSDLLSATGTISIDSGAAMHVAPENGSDNGKSYSLGTYTIATATGGVSGTFDSISDDYLFLGFDLGYDANNVYLTSYQVVDFNEIALTVNQKAAASGIDSLGSGTTIFDAVLGLGTDDEARAAFDATSGEGFATQNAAFLQDSRYVREAMLGAAAQGGGWASGYGAMGTFASDGNAAAANFATGGLVAGYGLSLGDAWLNASLHSGMSHLSIADRATSTSSTEIGGGLTGGFALDNTHFAFGAAYTHHAVSTTRDVAIGDFSDHLTASYTAGTAQLFGEVSHDFALGDMVLTPFASAAYVRTWAEGFTESGGAAALSTEASNSQALFTTLGLRAEREVDLANGVTARVSGTLGWRHGFGNTAEVTNSFASGNSFTVYGTPGGKDALVLGAGAEFDLAPGATLDLTYSGEIASGGSDHALSAILNVTF